MHGDHNECVPLLARVLTFRSVGISLFPQCRDDARRPSATTYPGRLRVLVAYAPRNGK
jgi:hypothetical protein